MAALPESRLRQMIDRFEQVEARMGVATDAKEIVQLSRDHAELKRIAEKAKAAGIEKVAFDRAGFAFHGRVKALAEAAREAGLQF